MFIEGAKRIEEESQVRTLARKMVDHLLQADRHRSDDHFVGQIRPIPVPALDNFRRYPTFVEDARIVERNRVTTWIQSPGSQRGVHTVTCMRYIHIYMTDETQGGRPLLPDTRRPLDGNRRRSLLGGRGGNQLERGIWLVQEDAGEVIHLHALGDRARRDGGDVSAEPGLPGWVIGREDTG